MTFSMHLDLAELIVTLYDDIISYAHYSSTEGWSSMWYSNHDIVDCKHEDSISGRRVICYWTGRALEPSAVSLTSRYSINDSPTLWGQILSSVDFPASKTSSTSLQKDGAFYPVRPFNECSWCFLISSTDSANRNPMAQSGSSIRNHYGLKSCALLSKKSIFNFVVQSKQLYRRLKTSCHQALISRNQLAMSFIFKALGYGSIFFAWGMHIDVYSESLQLLQIKDTHRKLYAQLKMAFSTNRGGGKPLLVKFARNPLFKTEEQNIYMTL